MLKYVIIGAGGTGGIIGFHMAKVAKDVTLIARGKHLDAIRKAGLKIEMPYCGEQETVKIKAASMEEYDEKADVIFVCVKNYSLRDIVPFIKRIAHEKTIVIPILNVYGTGGRMQKELPCISVLDGCIYVSAYIKEPGVILREGKMCRIFFGERENDLGCIELEPEEGESDSIRTMIGPGVRESRIRLREIRDIEKTVESDLKDSGIEGILSEDIRKDAMQKFSYVSPIGVAGLYFDGTAGDFRNEGPQQEFFKALVNEIADLAGAMGISFEEDLVEVNLKILKSLAPEATTSMQRDVKEGKASEADGLVFEVIRLAEEYGVDVPCYRKAAEKISRLI